MLKICAKAGCNSCLRYFSIVHNLQFLLCHVEQTATGIGLYLNSDKTDSCIAVEVMKDNTSL